MWGQLTSFTQALKEQAEHAVRDAGLDQQLTQVRSQVGAQLNKVADSVLTLEPHKGDPSRESQGEASATAALPARDTPAAGVVHSNPVVDLQADSGDDGWGASAELSAAGTAADDAFAGWDFQEVPLTAPASSAGSPAALPVSVQPSPANTPLRSPRSKGIVRLSPAKPAESAVEAENTALKARLKAVEEEAADVLGELEEAKDELRLETQARGQAEQRAVAALADVARLEQQKAAAMQKASAEAESHAAERAKLQRTIDSLTVQLTDYKAAAAAAEQTARQRALELERLKQQLALSPHGNGHSGAAGNAGNGSAETAQPALGAHELQKELQYMQTQLADAHRQLQEGAHRKPVPEQAQHNSPQHQRAHGTSATAADGIVASTGPLENGHGAALSPQHSAAGSNGTAAADEEVKEYKAKLAKAKRQLISYKAKLTEATAARDAAVSEADSLRQQLQHSGSTQLSGNIPAAEAELSAGHLQSEAASVVPAPEQHRSSQSSAEHVANTPEAEVADSILWEQLAVAERRAGSLAAELNAVRHEHDALAQRLVQLDAVTAERDSLLQELSEAQKLLEPLRQVQGSLAQSAQQRHSLEAELRMGQQAAHEAHQSQQQLTERCTALETELNEARAQHAGHLHGLEGQLADANSRCESAVEQLRSAQCELGKGKELRQQLAQAQHLSDSLTVQVGAAQERSDGLNSQLAETTCRCDSLAAELAATRLRAEQASQLLDQLHAADGRCSDLQAQVAAAEQHSHSSIAGRQGQGCSTDRDAAQANGAGSSHAVPADATGIEAILARQERCIQQRQAEVADMHALAEMLRCSTSGREQPLQPLQHNPLFSPQKEGGLPNADTCNAAATNSAQTMQLAEGRHERAEHADRLADASSTSTAAAELAAKDRQLADLQQQTGPLQAEVSALKAALHLHEQQLGEGSVQLAEAQAERQHLAQQHADAQARLAALQQAHDELRLAHAEQEQLCASIAAELKQLQGQHQVAAGEAAEKLQEHQRSAAEAAEQLQAKEAELAEAARQVAALQADLEARRLDIVMALRQAVVQGASEKEQQLSQRLTEATQQLAVAQAQAAELSQQLEAARRELHAAKAEAGKQAGENAALMRMLEERGAELELVLTESEAAAKKAAATEAQLRSAVESKATELAAIQDGAQAESSLTLRSLREAQARAQEAEARAEALQAAAVDAEADLIAAREDAEAALAKADKRCLEAQARTTAAQEQAAQLQQQVEDLTHSLAAERAAAQADLNAAQHDFQQRLAAGAAQARTSAQAEADRIRADLDDELAARGGELSEALDDIQRLEAALASAGSAEAQHAQLQGQLEATLAELAAVRAELELSRAEVARVQADAQQLAVTMAERQKKFTMLNSGYRRKEDALKLQLEEAAGQLAAAQRDAQVAAQQSARAVQEHQQLEAELEQLTRQVEQERAARERAEGRLAVAEEATAAAAARVVAAEGELAAQRAAQAAAPVQQESSEDFERRVAAAVAGREEQAAQRMAEAEARVEAALSELRQAELRAEAAELAKIELSLKLAEVADSQEGPLADVSGVPSRQASAAGACSSEVEVLQRRCEEAELAAAVGTRRAAAAEAQLDLLKQQLDAAEKRAKELGWQVKMMADPQQIGGRRRGGQAPDASADAGEGSRVTSLLDMFGCGTNYRG